MIKIIFLNDYKGFTIANLYVQKHIPELDLDEGNWNDLYNHIPPQRRGW